MNDPSNTQASRLHHLDALRAFAMLLGIALHASLAYTGYPWIVQDRQSHIGFGLFFSAIHGFRMPLFIMLSGYFTMMMYRRRGLPALLKQRLNRVFIPCMLGLVTIIPALNVVSVWARNVSQGQDQARSRPVDRAAGSGNLVESIRAGDLAELERKLEAGADPNELDSEFHLPPLGWTGLYGHADLAEALIKHGADVHVKGESGFVALHQAAFMGHPEVASLLLEHGADPLVQGPNKNERSQDTPFDSTKIDHKITSTILYYLRVPNRPEEELTEARTEVRKMLAKAAGIPYEDVVVEETLLVRARKAYAGWISSDRFRLNFHQNGEPFHLILTSTFHHLWFLWTLCWLVLFFVLALSFVNIFSISRIPQAWIISPLRYLWVIPVTMIPQLFMGSFQELFGPDTSVGLIPQPHMLLYFGIFFAFGAFYFDADDKDGRLGRKWWLNLPICLLVLFPLGQLSVGQTVFSGLMQTIYVWAMSFGLIGLSRKLVKRENFTIRYLSDSAYWLYLAHLPLLVVLQVWTREWDWSAGSKFLFVTALATAILLVSYQTLVRHTIVGRLVNGPRLRKESVSATVLGTEISGSQQIVTE